MLRTFPSASLLLAVVLSALVPALGAETPHTQIALRDGRWLINGRPTNPGSAAEGLLMNVRMVNAVFEDRRKSDFDPEANTDRFIARIPDYAAHGVNAFTICLQGGMPGYEGAVNSAFEPDGTLRLAYLARVERVIRTCDAQGAVVILGLYYQRQSAILRNEASLRAGVVNAARWVRERGFQNVVLEIANEYPHSGFVHALIRDPKGQASLIRLAKETAPGLLVSASGYGDGKVHAEVAEVSDFLLPHWNGTKVGDIPTRIAALKKFGKPIVCNEDDKVGTNAVAALRACVENGASYGLMLKEHNQTFPFHFDGAADDPVFYAELRKLTSPRPKPPAEPSTPAYFPPPESTGGWRKLDSPDDIRRLAGMDPTKLDALRDWLLKSDNRNFAAVVIRNGYIVLEVERGNSSKTDARRVASVSKAVCATVLAIASERSQQGKTPRKMTFEDRAFDFIPWAQPWSDPRKTNITVKQLLNHTSGICPEANGAPNDGSWEYVLGHTGDPRTAKLAFAPGTACGYSTHALAHAALVCETVTGKPYDQFAIEALFKPLGIEHWWFQFYDGGAAVGRHPSHGLGMPARDLARIAYCMMLNGRWGQQQIIPQWFVEQTAAPTHDVSTPEMRWKLAPQVFSHGWELPARHRPESGRSGKGIPADARSKPGSGGQLIAFVPSLDLVVTRQTGGSGEWEYDEYLRRACAAVLPDHSERTPSTGDSSQTDPAHLLAPFFNPSAEFADQLGTYRSPLLRNDGSRVQSAAEWPKRRAEILRDWHDMMGPWPPIFERPRVELLSTTNREGLTQQQVRIEIAAGQTGEGWLLKPRGTGPFPAVLVVYYEPETSVGLNPKQTLRDFGLQLARRGFVTLSIGTPGDDAWKPDTGTARCQPLSFHAYVAANCWQALANLSEVDRARIGVVGHSYGGKWALFAAALWDKFACVAVSDPGVVFDETRPNVNYWEPWYLGFEPNQPRPKRGVPTAGNPRTGAYRKMIESGRDLHELHALIAPRPLLVSGGAEDPPSRWVALNHAVAVNRLLGLTNRVALTSRSDHSPTEESNEQLYAFFEQFLQPPRQ